VATDHAALPEFDPLRLERSQRREQGRELVTHRAWLVQSTVSERTTTAVFDQDLLGVERTGHGRPRRQMDGGEVKSALLGDEVDDHGRG